MRVVCSRACSGGNVRTGKPGQITDLLLKHPLLSEGHAIESVKIAFRYAAGYSPPPGKVRGHARKLHARKLHARKLHARAHARTRAHAYTHTHTHTHVHLRMCMGTKQPEAHTHAQAHTHAHLRV
eukprot:5186594-Pleurochrysis_carterae.AAC.1